MSFVLCTNIYKYCYHITGVKTKLEKFWSLCCWYAAIIKQIALNICLTICSQNKFPRCAGVVTLSHIHVNCYTCVYCNDTLFVFIYLMQHQSNKTSQLEYRFCLVHLIFWITPLSILNTLLNISDYIPGDTIKSQIRNVRYIT